MAEGRRSASGCRQTGFAGWRPCHLEGNIEAKTDDLGANLDQLLFEAGQRPVLDRFWRYEGAQKVAEIVGKGMKLNADCVGSERAAPQQRPIDLTLALFDPLFAGAALIVEGHDILDWMGQVGDYEADTGIKLTRMPLDLRSHPARL